MLLKVKDLTIKIENNTLVNNVSFTLAQDQCLGIVGESGSGKSLTSFAINGLLDEQFDVRGSIRFNGDELLTMSAKKRRQMRGKHIAMVMQSPMTAFNPLFTIGNQVEETLCLHLACGRKQALETMADTFARVNLKKPHSLFKKYPHELSGGMLQRIMISMALVLSPELLIADEPTTAIDYISQKEVIRELQKIRELSNSAIIFVSHDLSLVSSIADQVQVMSKGEVIETGTSYELFHKPQHEHTRYLINTRMKLVNRFQQMMSQIDVN